MSSSPGGGDDRQQQLKLLSTWRSPFGLRVELALHLKGLRRRRGGYEYCEEDLGSKSDLLLRSNPVRRKVPVLIHAGVRVCESLAILEYIDEVYGGGGGGGPSLLPADPYGRAVARFWAAYITDKLVAQWWKMFRAKTEEEKAAATVAAVETLEGALRECSAGGTKPFFGSAATRPATSTSCWAGSSRGCRGRTEALCGVELFDAGSTPLLVAWAERFAGLDAAKAVLPDVGRLVEYVRRSGFRRLE